MPPAVAPEGTKGEFVSAPSLPASAQGIRGPIGLGFRVPMLVVSPFARGGFVCSARFDHTSVLRLIEARFGAEVPNLTEWRRGAVGDLTGAFNFARPDASVPALPQPSSADQRVLASNCTSEPATLIPTLGSQLPGYPVPPNSMPAQEAGVARRPSGPACSGSADGLRVTLHGLPRDHCSPYGLRVKVIVIHDGRLTSVVASVNGKRIRRTRRGSFVLRIPRRRLRAGRNRLVVTARGASGHVVSRSASFRHC